MRVILTTWRAVAGHTQRPGAVLDLPDDEARRLLAAGQAVLDHEGRRTPESAAIAAPHDAALERPQPRRAKR